MAGVGQIMTIDLIRLEQKKLEISELRKKN